MYWNLFSAKFCLRCEHACEIIGRGTILCVRGGVGEGNVVHWNYCTAHDDFFLCNFFFIFLTCPWHVWIQNAGKCRNNAQMRKHLLIVDLINLLSGVHWVKGCFWLSGIGNEPPLMEWWIFFLPLGGGLLLNCEDEPQSHNFVSSFLKWFSKILTFSLAQNISSLPSHWNNLNTCYYEQFSHLSKLIGWVKNVLFCDTYFSLISKSCSVKAQQTQVNLHTVWIIIPDSSQPIPLFLRINPVVTMVNWLFNPESS